MYEATCGHQNPSSYFNAKFTYCEKWCRPPNRALNIKLSSHKLYVNDFLLAPFGI